MLHYAAALELIYQGISEDKMRRILYHLDMANEGCTLDLDEMKKLVLPYSCITTHIEMIFQCNACKQWVHTNLIFCPYCSATATDDLDWKTFQLAECHSISCNGNATNYLLMLPEQRREICCNHLSRLPKSRYVLYIPPEAMVAEYIRSGLANTMFGLTEEEIVAGVREADSVGYHSVFYSENARDIYQKVGYSKAAQAVTTHLSTPRMNDEKLLLSMVVEGEKWLPIINQNNQSKPLIPYNI